MDPPAFRTQPLSTLRKASPSAEKRNRRAIQETNAAAREMADYWAQYSPTTVQGTDGHTYQVEGRRTKDTATGRALWSISLSGKSINIAIPLCSFQVIGGSQPPVKVNGTAVDYADPTKNILPLSSDLSLIALECEIDDTRPEAINTTQKRIANSKSLENDLGARSAHHHGTRWSLWRHTARARAHPSPRYGCTRTLCSNCFTPSRCRRDLLRGQGLKCSRVRREANAA